MVMVAVATSVLFVAQSASAQRRQVMLDKVVAVVGGSSILYSELVEYSEALVDQRRQMGYTSDRDPMDEALEALLEQKLLYNQALIDSVPVNIVCILLQDYFNQRSSQLKKRRCQSTLFCGWSTQWFSSGKINNSAGMPRSLAAL